MWLEEIKIKNFRNYDGVEVVFEKGINYLFGSNGVGKTNLIEAIYYIGNLGSFRTNDDRNLIKDSKGGFNVSAVVNGVSYDLKITRDKKILNVDGIAYPRYRDYIGKVNVIEFCPEQVYLLKDFPKDRRRFMDKEISKIDNQYLNDMLVYNKLLKQRNELLKSDDIYSEQLLNVIDDKISELQVSIINKRISFLQDIEKIINEFDVSLSKMYKLQIKYECTFKSINKESIIESYYNSFSKDKEKMSTNLGVHKDDFKVYINENDASNFGSQGEQRFIVLLMKLALLKLVKNKIGKFPIMVLDDVFSELDVNRKREIYRILKEFEQVFITGCDIKDIEGVTNCVSYEIKENQIKRIEEE